MVKTRTRSRSRRPIRPIHHLRRHPRWQHVPDVTRWNRRTCPSVSRNCSKSAPTIRKYIIKADYRAKYESPWSRWLDNLRAVGVDEVGLLTEQRRRRQRPGPFGCYAAGW